MITKISIENFKGIGERIEIPIKPLTLFFGANSAGKSSIMHAFHYAREVFERHNLDADSTIAGGDFIDLGGFANLVHEHDVSREVRIRLDLNLKDTHWLDFTEDIVDPSTDEEIFQNPMESAWAEICVAYNSLLEKPHVKSYVVGINGEEFGRIDSQYEAKRVAFGKINFDHPIFERQGGRELDDPWDTLWESHFENRLSSDVPLEAYFRIVGQEDALPLSDSVTAVWEGPGHDGPANTSLEPEIASLSDATARAISFVFGGVAETVRDELRSFCYLGPIRQKPPRGYTPPHSPDPSRWATGLGAWDALHEADEKFILHVNAWLIQKYLLDTGYTIGVKKLRLLDTEGPLYTLLVSGRAFDEMEDVEQELQQLPQEKRFLLADSAGFELSIQDVGEGIAQVLPVVVAALQPDATVVQIEQPGLHLHPEQQASIGDLLISGALGESPKSIIAETHSEHLVLRVLRRIRETARGDKWIPGVPVTPNDVAIYYVHAGNGQTEVVKIDVDDKGEFVQPWPDNFFEIGFHERFG